jgi:predicted glutamine amidotransferase
MCRMLGIVASEETSFRFCLHEAPRSLSCLSREHPDGWGVAVFDVHQNGWRLQKQPGRADGDSRFFDAAVTSRGHALIAHVRKRTVGPIGVDNTHPFRRGRWIFAHNGTIDDVDALRAQTSAVRLAEIVGTTDSELFFAYLLTFLDASGDGEGATAAAVETALLRAVRALSASPALGAANFLLSNGEDLYAFRRGRSLFSLERKPGDEVRESRRSPETGAVVDTRWTSGRHAVLIASEAMTDEPWLAVEEGTLLSVRGRPVPAMRVLQSRVASA